MTGLITDADLYQPLALLSIHKRYAIWRYFTHIADWAPKQDTWREQLHQLDFTRFDETTMRLMRAVLSSAPDTIALLSDKQLKRLSQITPPADPHDLIVLDEQPVGLTLYKYWGFII